MTDDVNFDEPIEKAMEAIQSANGLLSHLFQGIDEATLMDMPPEEKAHAVQLILQYRLDTQDALAALVRLDNGILQVLGINRLQSSRVLIERLMYALGKDDLKNILRALSLLVQSLQKMAYQKDRRVGPGRRVTKSHFQRKKESAELIDRLNKATAHQKKFISSIKDISRNVKMLTKRAAIGPMLDHIAAVQGPVSKFYQAIQNGIKHSHSLYQKANTHLNLDKTLGPLLKQPAAKSSLFSPNKINQPDSLEDRASEKRLGKYFNLKPDPYGRH